jgi:hypothetical protein
LQNSDPAIHHQLGDLIGFANHNIVNPKRAPGF